jgi:hypothetical protein
LGRADPHTHQHRVDQPERSLDLRDDLGRGGGGERHERHAQLLAQRAQRQERGPEVVAPLADAVRLVDRDRANAQRGDRLAARAVVGLWPGAGHLLAG